MPGLRCTGTEALSRPSAGRDRLKPRSDSVSGWVVSVGASATAGASAATLAKRTGRRLFAAADESALHEILLAAAESGNSVCVSLGSQRTAQWPDGAAPETFAAVLRAARSVVARGHELVWGLLCAPDPRRFAQLMEQGRPIGGTGGGEALLMPRSGAPWEEPVLAGDAPASRIEVIPTSRFAAYRGALSAKRYDAIFIEGHGRRYCVNEGQFCAGATGLSASGGHLCLGRYACASERHLRAPVTEMRAGLMVLDACEAGGFAGPAAAISPWPMSIAILGSVDALICSDVAVARPNGAISEVYAIARSSPTLGAFAAALNAARAYGNPPMPYHLLGDPEWPCQVPDENPPPAGKRDVVDERTEADCAAPLHEALVALRCAARETVDATSLPNRLAAPVRRLCASRAEQPWPSALWPMRDQRTRLRSDHCPHCDAPQPFERRYEGPDGPRLLVECAGCRLIADHPADRPERIALKVVDDRAGGPAQKPSIEVTLAAGHAPLVAVLALCLAVPGGAELLSPPVRTLSLAAGETRLVQFGLRRKVGRTAAQIHFVKLLAFVNGRFILAGAPVSVPLPAAASAAA